MGSTRSAKYEHPVRVDQSEISEPSTAPHCRFNFPISNAPTRKIFVYLVFCHPMSTECPTSVLTDRISDTRNAVRFRQVLWKRLHPISPFY